VLARVSVDQAINPHQHPCPPGLVLQTVKPVAVLIGLFDSHLLSVARRLHKLQRKRARGGFNWNLTPITNYQLPITNYQLPITNYQLPN
jgi:hypothetical protein